MYPVNVEMIRLLLALGIAAPAVVGVGSQCPAARDLVPCSCVEGGSSEKVASVLCSNLFTERDLVKVLQATRGYDIFSLEISYSSLRFLPHDAFEGNQINMIELRNSSILSLSDEGTAFQGLEDHLNVLEIESCSYVNSWDWSQLKGLKHLVEISVTDTDLLYLEKRVEQISHLNIEALKFTYSKISWLADEVFSPFTHIQRLKLDNNDISEIKRSMFPNPAPALVSLSFSYNSIKILPEDIFVNMPALRSLYLSGNKINTLDEVVFKPVWEQLNMLFIYHLPLICDCRIAWIIKVKGEPKFIHSSCHQPTSLKGRMIISLKLDEIWC